MFVKIFKLEESENALTDFGVGTHVIGRGPALQCNDRRVSHNHATLEVGEDNVKITSTHINPCFLKMADSKTVTILSQDSSADLNDGDAFAFLPDTFWFKIKIIENSLPQSPVKGETEDKQSLKRHLNDSEEDTEDKRRKVDGDEKEQNNDLNEKQENNDSNEKQDNKDDEGQLKRSTSTESIQIKDEIDESDDKNENDEVNNSHSNNEDIKTEDTNNDQNEANGEDVPACIPASSVKSKRERCWYGAECYRKNANHREEFTHPGDSDFESDPDDNRPSCSYGADCYRKNKDHRKNYKHPPRDPPSKQKKKRTRKKVDLLGAATYDPDDLSDLSEDPFEEDGDSDEYVEDSDGDDSDWEDSQDIDEDSENVRRLVREAKRFTKK